MKTIKFLTIIAAVAVIFNSCSKDGATGPAGANGTNGNANVTGTNSVLITSWTDNSGQYYTQLNVPALTASIAANGAVEVFFSIDGINWVSLPFTYVGTTDAFWSYVITTGTVDIYFTWNVGDNGDPNTFYGATCRIRVVCIAASDILLHPNTNWKNWSEVNAIMQAEKASK